PVQLAALDELPFAFAEIQFAWVQTLVPGMPGVTSQHQEGPLGSHRTTPLQQCLQPTRTQRVESTEGVHQLIAEQERIRRHGDPLQYCPLRGRDLQSKGSAGWFVDRKTARKPCWQTL